MDTGRFSSGPEGEGVTGDGGGEERVQSRGAEVVREAQRPLVVLDANALMMPFQFSINLDAELQRVLPGCKAVVPSSVVEELRALSASKKRPEARAALELARRFRVVEAEGVGDEAVLSAALRLGAVLLTNDASLRKRARSAGLRVMYLREKSHLEMG
ncbi:MAG: twitching motility protein PilT [Thermoplasmata archaeon]